MVVGRIAQTDVAFFFQPFGHGLAPHGASNQEALQNVAALLGQVVGHRLVLDAFSHDLQPEVVCQLDGGGNDDIIVRSP